MASSNATAGFDVDSFANYLITDLGFLLVLFGDLPTKQFLALSTGWYDNIALAVTPIGVPTILVSAIRVAGSKWLRAIIGRARESRTSAEVEVLSSTSTEVCELWSGNGIVRVTGKAPIKEIIRHIPRVIGSDSQQAALSSDTWMDLAEASSANYSVTRTGGGGKTMGKTTKEDEALEKLMIASSTSAPNLTLNLDRHIRGRAKGGSWARFWARFWGELWAVFALVLQCAVVTVWCLTTFAWKLGRAHRLPPKYGLPCAVIGAGFLFFGVLICGHVVEDVTVELHAAPVRNLDEKADEVADRYTVMRIQRSCTAGSQNFEGCLIHNKVGDPNIPMSRRLPATERVKRHEILTLVGTLLGCIGFIVQFIGLRTLHWGATIAQLVSTVTMTAVRAWLRWTLLQEPRCEELLAEHEVSDATFAICRSELPASTVSRRNWVSLWTPKCDEEATNHPETDYKYYGWGLLTSVELEKSIPKKLPADLELSSISDAPTIDKPTEGEADYLKVWVQHLVKTRVELGRLTEWDEYCTPWAEIVATAIEDVFRKLESMSLGGRPSLKLKVKELSRSWELATYVRVDKKRIVKSTFSVSPDELPLGFWYAESDDRGGQIRRVKDIYGAILCLWHCRIAKRRKGIDYKPQFPFARVAGTSNTGPERSDAIQKWLRTPLWPVHQDLRWPISKHKRFDPALSFGRQFAAVPSVSNQSSSSAQPDPNTLALAVDAGLSIPRNCAYELFSMYMFDVTSKIERINEHSERDSDGKLTNNVVEDLAIEVRDSGLTNSLEEARTLLVPSFYYHNLLSPPPA